MRQGHLRNAAELVEYINEIGVLPLLPVGVSGWSAEEALMPECRYQPRPEGGWDFPLWDWKGEIIRDSGCGYGGFLKGKATFVSREIWPDFCNWRRSRYPEPAADSIEETILEILRMDGSAVSRDLRRECGFNGPKMRGRFDSYVTRLQMAARVVIQDFVYPRDRNGREYGWGLALLTTPEQLMGAAACRADRTPEESYARIHEHLAKYLPIPVIDKIL